MTNTITDIKRVMVYKVHWWDYEDQRITYHHTLKQAEETFELALSDHHTYNLTLEAVEVWTGKENGMTRVIELVHFF